MLQQYECPVCGKPTQVVFCAKTSEVCCSVCGYVFDEHYEVYADDPAKKPKYATLAVSALGCAPPKLKGVTLPMYEDDIEFRVGRNISLFLSLLGMPGKPSSSIYMDAQKVAQAIINRQRQHKSEIKLTVQ